MQHAAATSARMTMAMPPASMWTLSARGGPCEPGTAAHVAVRGAHLVLLYKVHSARSTVKPLMRQRDARPEIVYQMGDSPGRPRRAVNARQNRNVMPSEPRAKLNFSFGRSITALPVEKFRKYRKSALMPTCWLKKRLTPPPRL